MYLSMYLSIYLHIPFIYLLTYLFYFDFSVFFFVLMLFHYFFWVENEYEERQTIKLGVHGIGKELGQIWRKHD